MNAHIGKEGNEQAVQVAKVGAAGGMNIKQIPMHIPWKVAKNKIEDFTTTIWMKRWENDPQYKHTKLLYAIPNENKCKDVVVKMGSDKLGTWIKGITGHNNLAYFL